VRRRCERSSVSETASLNGSIDYDPPLRWPLILELRPGALGEHRVSFDPLGEIDQSLVRHGRSVSERWPSAEHADDRRRRIVGATADTAPQDRLILWHSCDRKI
jgi:hypothetical protein